MKSVLSGNSLSVIYNSSDTPVCVAEPLVNYKGLALPVVKNEICPLVPKLCLADRGYSMEDNETRFTIFRGQMHLLWILQV
jgi:hypothetical protein